MYHTLPPTYEQAAPIIQRAMREGASSVLPLVRNSKRPDPPRNLISQAGSLQALITWNSPVKSDDIAGWKIYKDNEGNLFTSIMDPDAHQVSVPLPANTSTFVYVSSMNAAGRESIKVQVMATSNTDQIVSSGTSGGTSGSTPKLPPGYSYEPTGGFIRIQLRR